MITTKKYLITLFTILSIMALMPIKAQAINVQDLATPLVMNGTWSQDHWLASEDDAHYYKIEIPSDGGFTIKIMSYGSWCCYWELYSEDLTDKLISAYAQHGTETSPKTDEKQTALSKGTCYLKIYGNNAGRYKVQTSYTSYHTSDGQAVSYDSPQSLTEGKTITGALTETD